MEIKVVKEEIEYPSSMETGGEYAVCSLEVYIDKNLPIREQRLRLIHAILENYLPFLEHGKIEELEELIDDALIQLERNGGKG